jgi:hypothetical protein
MDPSLSTFNSSTLGKMALPRRHAQRQALRQRNKVSVGNLRSQVQRQRHKPRNTRNKRVGYHMHIDSKSESDFDVDVDTDREEEDSGYGSNRDNEAEYLNELVSSLGRWDHRYRILVMSHGR